MDRTKQEAAFYTREQWQDEDEAAQGYPEELRPWDEADFYRGDGQ